MGIVIVSCLPERGITLQISHMLSGELPYTVDAKGRMSFPLRFREILGESFILTRGADKRLVAYSQGKWLSLVEKVQSMHEGKNKEYLKQIYVKGAIPVECDKLGRILVPQALREYAGLYKDVYVVGAIDTAEIWDKNTYEAFTQSISPEELYAALDSLE